MEHKLKTGPKSFNHIWSGDKTFELRKDDRGFRVGDRLKLQEWSRTGCGSYTGREITATITFLMSDPRLEEGWVIMSFSHLFLKPKDWADDV